jgi:hypothetical protein
MEIFNEAGEKITLKKTVSIGVIGTDQLEDWEEYGETNAVEFLNKMTALADVAVYVSKRGDEGENNGRNRVTLYEEGLKK